jgi:hypothetical protein
MTPPSLSEHEKVVLTQQCNSVTDVFLQGVMQYLIGERENGFQKAFSAWQRTCENYGYDNLLVEQKLRRILQLLADGDASEWSIIIRMAEKKDTPVRRIILCVNPLHNR